MERYQPAELNYLHWVSFYRIIVFLRFPALQGRPHVHQGPRPGGGPDQAGHVPEVRTQEALVCEDEPPAHRTNSQ